MKAAVLMGLVGVPLAAAHAPAQTSDGPASAVNAIIDYRVQWLGDSTRISACSLARALGEPPGFPQQIRPPFRPLLDRQTNPCAGPSTVDERWPKEVRLDSLVLGDSVGHAYVTVRRGEQTHREDYLLRANPRGQRWFVREMRMWGAGREYRERPPHTQPRQPPANGTATPGRVRR